jgi:hypothetical protein
MAIAAAPAAAVSAEPGPAPLQAVLVIHGIGQQQPFQPLDSFVNGLRATLRNAGQGVATTHLLFGREEVFDHCVRIEASDESGGLPSVRLDVYEFYWAPLTQGKASFAQIVRWLAATGFSPVRRLAFNLPLLIRRAESRARRGAERAQSGAVASPAPTEGVPQVSRPRPAQLLRAAQAAIARSRTFWFCLEFAREVWRLVYVSLAAVALAGLAAGLVSRSSALAKQLPEALGPTLPDLVTWPGAATTVFALVAAIAAIGLGVSIPEQIRDLARLQKVQPLVFAEAGRAARGAFGARAGDGFLTRLLAGAAAGARHLWSATEARMRWQTELRARRWFLPLSILGFLLAALVVTWLSAPSPRCVGPVCPARAFHDLLAGLVTANLVVVSLLLGAAFVLKRVFVDYLADVALYTTADENSAFFATRAAILKEATRRIRFLLRDRQYGSVAIAGHSLGSVIGYDAINSLRVEAQLPRGDGLRGVLDEIGRLAAKLSPADATTASALVGQLERAAVRELVEPPGDAAARDRRAFTVPVTVVEVAKLTTFITFGSPLNKVLYFFRTRIKVYETLRQHIVQELHGFRQLSDLLTRDPTIVDRTTPVDDQLRWVNIYSPMDPVSARLVFYSGVHEHRRWFLVPGKCHVSYWHDPKFYREVLAALQGRCAEEAAPATPRTP